MSIKTNIRIKVNSEQSKKIQEICFSKGVAWYRYGEKLSHIKEPYLCIDDEPSQTTLNIKGHIFFRKHKDIKDADVSDFEWIEPELFIKTNGTCEMLDVEQNSFNKYGFETPEFEGEILKEIDGKVLGYVKDTDEYNTSTIALLWNSKTGKINENYTNIYDLTPIKKEWYEENINFPIMLKNIDTDRLFVVYKLKDKFKSNNFRLATEQEISEINCA